jgi:hypothetical protein
MAMNRPEEQLHRACADLLRLYEARGLLAFCHVPNGFGRTPAEAGIAKALGQRAGVPDLLVLVWLPGGRSFSVERLGRHDRQPIVSQGVRLAAGIDPAHHGALLLLERRNGWER